MPTSPSVSSLQETQGHVAKCAMAQGVRAFGLHEYRCIGKAKMHLQHVLTAAAINFVRVSE